MTDMDIQGIAGVLGSVAGVVGAYYGYLQYKKGSNNNFDSRPVPTLQASKEIRLWSDAVDKAIFNFKKSRKNCDIEVIEQKNFDKIIEKYSTSEITISVHFLGVETPMSLQKFWLKINKEGDILESKNLEKRK